LSLLSVQAFRRIYEEPIVQSRQPEATEEVRALGVSRASELSRLISMFCLRRTADINNKYLPPKHDVVVICKPSPLQLQLYQKLLSSRFVQSCLSGNGAHHLVSDPAKRE
jgi:DNA repair and recombination protein RAD54B